jgi:ubiquinol-cytochrome c reductase cytochrome b subunit
MADQPETRRRTPSEVAARWLDDRLGLAAAAKKTLRKPFPGHWSFLLGEITLFALIILFLTGTFLALFYRPDTSHVIYAGPYEPLQGVEITRAYESTLRLSFEVRAGLLMRQIHHHAANVFMAALVLHMFRVFFQGSYRKPREFMWVTGILLLIAGIGAGFTGYSLPDDLLSGSGLQIAYSVLLSVPFAGPFVAFVAMGGEMPNPDLIGRLHILHVMIIPGVLAVLVTVHLAILFRIGHAQHPGEGRTNRNIRGVPFFPSQAMISMATFAGTTAILALMGGLFEINPVWVYGPFEPWRVIAPLQPDWYVGWLEGILRLWPAWDFEIFGVMVAQPFIPGVIGPGLIFTIAIVWPWIDQRWIAPNDEEQHLLDNWRYYPIRTGLGAAVFVFLLVMLVAGSNDVIAARFVVPVETTTNILRISIVLGPAIAYLLVHRWCVWLARQDEARGAPTPRERDRAERGTA